WRKEENQRGHLLNSYYIQRAKILSVTASAIRSWGKLFCLLNSGKYISFDRLCLDLRTFTMVLIF
ncbi:mCG118858, partial [Mus musculus]